MKNKIKKTLRSAGILAGSLLMISSDGGCGSMMGGYGGPPSHPVPYGPAASPHRSNSRWHNGHMQFWENGRWVHHPRMCPSCS